MSKPNRLTRTILSAICQDETPELWIVEACEDAGYSNSETDAAIEALVELGVIASTINFGMRASGEKGFFPCLKMVA
jgi:hypothetical protein